jgi:hypothetical protein
VAVVPSRDETIAILDKGYKRAHELIGRLPEAARLEPGIGAENWSARDLVGYYFFWEKQALEAIDAWAGGGAAPIDRLLYRGMKNVNTEAIKGARTVDYDEIAKQADWAHNALLGYIEGISDDLWESPPTARHMHSLGESLGRILLGPGGLYTHYDAHLPDLEAYVASVEKQSA